ncbi:MAG TPA: heavy metal-binding domain-containing protein [Herpetosiphonaceae bacterium]|nr:heavy metal-binding domain-containing protein [Herpetosiphonaceae bacterium]
MTAPEPPPIVPVWMITTAPELHGYRVVSSFGVVTGMANRWAAYITPQGWHEATAKTREEAFEQMALQAAARGANAIIAMRYDSMENTNGVSEVVAYGTAVVVEPLGR